MPKTTLEILSERRKSTVLLDQVGRVTTLERISKGTYREIDTFDNVVEYSEVIPADTPKEYLHRVDSEALLDHTPHYYETKRYNNLLGVVGHVGLELVLRYTVNGARFSTLKAQEDKLHASEHFLAVSPSIYFAVNDAKDVLERRYRDELTADSW